MLLSLIPRPLSSVFICDSRKKGLADLRKTFCSTDSQSMGDVNSCWQLQRPFDKVSMTHFWLSHQIAKEKFCKRNLLNLMILSMHLSKSNQDDIHNKILQKINLIHKPSPTNNFVSFPDHFSLFLLWWKIKTEKSSLGMRLQITMTFVQCVPTDLLIRLTLCERVVMYFVLI